MNDDPDVTVAEMVRERPTRSAITVVGPLLFVGGQFLNSYYHDVSLVYPAVFAALLIVMVVLTIQQQFAAFRSDQLRTTHTAVRDK